MDDAQLYLRRCEVRVPVKERAIVIDVGKTESLTCRLHDISMHGACIECPENVHLPTEFKVKTGSRWRKVRVKWRHKARLGIRFATEID